MWVKLINNAGEPVSAIQVTAANVAQIIIDDAAPIRKDGVNYQVFNAVDGWSVFALNDYVVKSRGNVFTTRTPTEFARLYKPKPVVDNNAKAVSIAAAIESELKITFHDPAQKKIKTLVLEVLDA